MPTYDHMKLIEACGGCSALWRALGERGYRITRQGVQMWKSRGVIPGAFVLPVLAIAARGGSFDLVMARIEDEL